MKIEEWFDPDNIEHLKAFKHLQEKGVWPVSFIIEVFGLNKIRYTPQWEPNIYRMMANKWIDYKLKGDLK